MRKLIAASIAALGLAALAGPLGSAAHADPVCIVQAADVHLCFVESNSPGVEFIDSPLIHIARTCVLTVCVEEADHGNNVVLNRDDTVVWYHNGHCHSVDSQLTQPISTWDAPNDDPADCEGGSPDS